MTTCDPAFGAERDYISQGSNHCIGVPHTSLSLSDQDQCRAMLNLALIPSKCVHHLEFYVHCSYANEPRRPTTRFPPSQTPSLLLAGIAV
jgi:hypothetical protein